MDDAEIYVIIRDGGPKLAVLVKAKFATLSEFARQAQITVSDASRFCRGKRKPPSHVVPRISAALGVPLPELDIDASELSKATDRTIRALRSALKVERKNVSITEQRLAETQHENRELRKTLDKIRNLAS